MERISRTSSGFDWTQEHWLEDITEEQEVELLKIITEYSSQVIAHVAGHIARILIKKIL